MRKNFFPVALRYSICHTFEATVTINSNPTTILNEVNIKQLEVSNQRVYPPKAARREFYSTSQVYNRTVW